MDSNLLNFVRPGKNGSFKKHNINGKKMEGTVKKIVATNIIPEVMNIRNIESLKDHVDRPEVLGYVIE